MTPNSSVSIGDAGVLDANTVSTRTFGSSMTSRTCCVNATGSSPGSRRQSSVASAMPGMTLCFMPARIVVALTVFVRMRARDRIAPGELLHDSPATALRRARGCRCSRSKYSRSSGTSSTGRAQSWTRCSARTSRSSALSSCGTEPWPGRPSAVSLSQSGPFSLTEQLKAGRRTPKTSAVPQPPSLSTYSASSSSGWCASIQSMPAGAAGLLVGEAPCRRCRACAAGRGA